MAKKAAPSGGKKRRRRKLKLTLKSRTIKKGESYSDGVGWSQAAGDTSPILESTFTVTASRPSGME